LHLQLFIARKQGDPLSTYPLCLIKSKFYAFIEILIFLLKSIYCGKIEENLVEKVFKRKD